MIGIIVVAAGSGTRLGQGRPKAFVSVAGQSILEHALHTVFSLAEECRVIVVVPADDLDEAGSLCLGVAGTAAGSLSVVPGGFSRQDSVRAGLTALTADVDVVLVHDAARAFTPVAQFELVVSAVRTSGIGVIPSLAVSDTIKQTDGHGKVVSTVDRSALVAVQTPQGFPRDALDAAYTAAAEEYTDDAALFAAAGHEVMTVAGDALAFKITTPWDLRRAESLGGGQPARGRIRSGLGIDVHAFEAEVPLWLGGLHWPGEPGLSGHSDGDAVAHSVCDALLSAAGLGDIGGLFGTSDDTFAGAHGDVFLTETVRVVTAAGFAILSVAVQVIAKRPKIAPRRVEIERYLSGLVGAPVSVSATTSDGLGFTGRGEGVAALSTALVEHTR